jgi:glycosyltransferase involved in cell wall biosynthesis
MFNFSVVIVCKNEEDIIGVTLQSLQELTDDIVVYDNGSTDKTIEIIKSYPVNLVQGNWEGFGKTKRKAVGFAKHNWILSLDADERPDDELKKSLSNLTPATEKTVYTIKFKNFLGGRQVRYGEWGRDKHIRLFNRNYAFWDEAEVHEQLVLPAGVKVGQIKGSILHETMKDEADYKNKMTQYALLNAEKYFRQGKKTSPLKQWLSPVFSFIQNYFLRLGFADGRDGFTCAKMTAWYTFLKYKKLKELVNRSAAGNRQSGKTS